MRKLLFLLGAVCLAQAVTAQSVVTHTIDGILNEWDTAHFTLDNETNISYSVANDNDYLYIAVKAKNRGVQMKMCRMGMSVFVDTRGKKREGTGLSYPLPLGGANGGSANGDRSNEEAMKERLAGALLFYKILGIEGYDDTKMTPIGSNSEGLTVMGGWDEQNELVLEYSFPMSLIGSVDKLANKEISVGFKLNGIQTSATASAAPANGRPGTSPIGRGTRGGSGQGGSDVFAASRENMAKEQYAWTKYTVIKK